jgi:hypothetical protein
MTGSRALLAGGGVALLLSLVLPWFSGGVTGWEHFAWADVALSAVALLALVAAAVPRAPLRLAVVVLCGLGIAVVFGHGFAPDEPTPELREVAAGGHVALAALAAAGVGALAPWSRRGGAALLVAAAAGLVGALLSGWGFEGGLRLTVGESSVAFYGPGSPDGFARWAVLDVALIALALALLVAAVRRLPLAVYAALALASLAVAACVVVGVEDQLWIDEGAAAGAAKGPVAALLALTAALAGLASRASTSRAYTAESPRSVG